MPSLEMEDPVIGGVSAVNNLLEELLQEAETIKQTASIEPPLAKSDFDDLPGRLARALAPAGSSEDTDENGDLTRARRFAIVETVARDKFSNLIVSGGRHETALSTPH
jgi:THO complex subunit 1